MAVSSGMDMAPLCDPMLKLVTHPATPAGRIPLVTLGTLGAPPGHQLETVKMH